MGTGPGVLQWWALRLRCQRTENLRSHSTDRRPEFCSGLVGPDSIGSPGLRFFQEQLYGQPERAVPGLILTLAALIGLGARSWPAFLASLLLFGGIWRYWSARLVIEDLSLGHIRLRVAEPEIWLTFDDGPGPETLLIVEELNRHGVAATFFFIGEQVERFPNLEELRCALRSGNHTVANHSFTHPSFLALDERQTEWEIRRTQELLEREFPSLTVPMFRPPFGYRKAETLEICEKLNLEVVGWSLNSLDFLDGSASALWERLERCLEGGVIILFHDGRSGRRRTLDALRLWLPGLQVKGFALHLP